MFFFLSLAVLHTPCSYSAEDAWTVEALFDAAAPLVKAKAEEAARKAEEEEAKKAEEDAKAAA